MSNPVYDVAILGCGEAGIFAAYELSRLHPGLKLLALDQGRDIYHRNCPIVAGKVTSCIQCPVCDTMCGFGGAGAFSDGKLNTGTRDIRHRFILETLTAHGAPESILTDAKPHVGTDYLHRVLASLRRELEREGICV